MNATRRDERATKSGEVTALPLLARPPRAVTCNSPLSAQPSAEPGPMHIDARKRYYRLGPVGTIKFKAGVAHNLFASARRQPVLQIPPRTPRVGLLTTHLGCEVEYSPPNTSA
jgi:hypothetical protein